LARLYKTGSVFVKWTRNKILGIHILIEFYNRYNKAEYVLYDSSFDSLEESGQKKKIRLFLSVEAVVPTPLALYEREEVSTTTCALSH